MIAAQRIVQGTTYVVGISRTNMGGFGIELIIHAQNYVCVISSTNPNISNGSRILAVDGISLEDVDIVSYLRQRPTAKLTFQKAFNDF